MVAAVDGKYSVPVVGSIEHCLEETDSRVKRIEHEFVASAPQLYH
jgi:hypothetical protein